jgi:hypothetical protein
MGAWRAGRDGGVTELLKGVPHCSGGEEAGWYHYDGA